MLVGAVMLQQQAFAQIVGYQFATPQSAGNEASLPASLINEGLTVTNLVRGVGWSIPGSTLPGGFVATRTVTSSAFADTSAMVAGNMYFGIKLTVKTNYKASLSNINYRLRTSSSSGSKLFFWKYSLDGINFYKINDPVNVGLVALTDANQTTVNLAGITKLQNLPAGTNVELRLYIGDTGGGTTAIGRSAGSTTTDYVLSVGGSVENVAAPPLLAWQFGSPSSVGNEATASATTVNSDLTATPLTRGGGLNADNSYPRSFTARALVTSLTTVADTTTAVANDMYIDFSLTAKPNHTVSLNKLNYKVRRSSGGANVWYWKYSTDGVIFNKLAEPFLLTEAQNFGMYGTPIDLSAIAKMQNIIPGATIYFRLYLNGANNSTGSSNIGVSDQYALNSPVLWVEGTTATILPITLSKFTGKAIGNNVKLDWTTASEKNNFRFELLSLRDGKTSVLGSVNGSGTTSSAKNYTFTDTKPLSGTNYYQLRQIDFDGTKVTHPEIVSVKIGMSQSNLTAGFSANSLNILLYTDKTGGVKITLTDMLGKVVASSNETAQEGQNSFTIPTNVKEGVYIVTILNSSNERVSKKIIK